MRIILTVYVYLSSPPLVTELQSWVMPFPTHRLRRLRATESMRSLVRETRLDPAQFILPLFVCPGEGVRREIGAMPGNYQMSIDELVKECAEVEALGIGGRDPVRPAGNEGRDGVGRIRR